MAATILVVGDSISAGYGVRSGAGWVDLLATRLDQSDCQHSVINASISGDTTDGGLRRLPTLLEQHQPDIVLIELGGNDGLRGFPLKVTRANLEQMIIQARTHEANIVLAGMQIPPNYGPRYADEFAALFPQLADKYQAVLIPSLLERVLTDVTLVQNDGIHPTEQAQPLLLDAVYPRLAPLLDCRPE